MDRYGDPTAPGVRWPSEPLTTPNSAVFSSGSPQAQILAAHLAVVRSDMIAKIEDMLSLIGERVEGFQKQVISKVESEFTDLRTENEHLRSELASTRAYSNKQETGGTGDTAPALASEISRFRSEDEEDVFFECCGPVQSSVTIDPPMAAQPPGIVSGSGAADGVPNSIVEFADGGQSYPLIGEGLNLAGLGTVSTDSNSSKSDLRNGACVSMPATVMHRVSNENLRKPPVQIPPSLPEVPEPPTDGPPLLKLERKTQQARFQMPEDSPTASANVKLAGIKHTSTERARIFPTSNKRYTEEASTKFSESESDEYQSIEASVAVKSVASRFVRASVSKSHTDGARAAKIFGGFRKTNAPANPPKKVGKEFSEKSVFRRTSVVREPVPVFADAAAMKERVRQVLTKHDYNVADFYWEEGMAQFVARSQYFEWATLSVIAFNAFWITVDLDFNEEELLMDSHTVFQIAEHCFCVYFTSEWLVRFLAFKVKRDCAKDGWFCFDTCLVIMMVLETWVMNLVLLLTTDNSRSGVLGNTSVLKLVRLVRLSRMARMAKLLHAVPELIILIKGIVVAGRTVFFTLLLLTIIIYFFAIVFRTVTDDTEVGDKYFPSVTASMGTLLLDGVIPDQSFLVRENDDSHALLGALVVMFILLATLTVMNMLVGVLCEVVSVVSAVEKEQLTVSFVKQKLLKMFENPEVDSDGSCSISRKEFEDLLVNEEAASIIQDMGVDVVGLVDFADVIFEDDIELTFGDFMELVLQLRGTNTCTVKDIVDLRKFVVTEFNVLQAKVDEIMGPLGDFRTRERMSRRLVSRRKASHSVPTQSGASVSFMRAGTKDTSTSSVSRGVDDIW